MKQFKDIILSRKTFEIVFVFTLVCSFVFWVIDIFTYGANSKQTNMFFGSPTFSDFLADFTNVVGYSSQKDPYHCLAYSGLQEKAYPPLTYVLMYPFSKLIDIDYYYENNFFKSMYSEPLFLLSLCAFFLIILVLFYLLLTYVKKGNMIVKNMVAMVLLLSAPMLYTLERGNILPLAILCITFYVFYYDSENKMIKEIALNMLAVSAALKVSPAFLGILLIYNKQYKDAIRAVFYGIVWFFIPFLFLDGGLDNVPQLIDNIKLQLETYSSYDGCSILACLTGAGIPLSVNFEANIKLFKYAIALILIFSGAFVDKKWEKVLSATLFFILLPSHSGYYNLLYLTPSIVLFLNEEKHNWLDIFVLFAFVLITVTYRTEISITLFNYCFGLITLVVCLFLRMIIVDYEIRKNLKINI